MSNIVVTVVSGETVDLGLSVPGMQGIPGPSGNPGPPPNLSIGAVQMTSASGATVTISGATPNYALNFALPTQSLVLSTQSGITYTTTPADNGKVIAFSSASGVTFVIASGLPSDFSCSVVRTGSGNVTISGASGVSVFSSSPTLKLAARYSVAAVFAFASNEYIATGDLAI